MHTYKEICVPFAILAETNMSFLLFSDAQPLGSHEASRYTF
jgi:hypothetical protein